VQLPRSRGAVSAALLAALTRPPSHDLSVPDITSAGGDVTQDEDLQLALWVCYELSYRGFDGVDDQWEHHPDLLRLRTRVEQLWLTQLQGQITVPQVEPHRVAAALRDLIAADDAPSLAGHLQRSATRAQFREFVAQRSVYHLKEADPHSWALPRLGGPVKAALVEIQADEYGEGRPERMHSTLFATTMRALDLDDSYGHYVDQVPAITLATSNVMSLFGLHRRWLGAILGHLAVLEMTSSLPNRRYGNGLRRLGGDEAATRFFDVHITADAVHEQIAAHDLCGGYVSEHPQAATDVLFGAACCLALEGQFARHLLGRWEQGLSTLGARLAVTA
jgi:Iron-containing redox enzyme